jgi:hypothetical protein
MKSCDMSILCILFINVDRQKCIIQWPATLVFVLFHSIFTELQHDIKISRKKPWPDQKVPEHTFQNV